MDSPDPPPRTCAGVSKTPTKIPDNRPKRNQGIVIDTLDDFGLSDYVIAVGTLIGPKNILSASKIANNRICLYLASTTLVNYLTENDRTIKVQNREFHARKLITPAKRILISNVCSSIPNILIENGLRAQGLNLVSQISVLKAAIHDEAYSHVESFRRQVFVAPPAEDFILPGSVEISFEETKYRVFLTFDGMTCFNCKQAGHTAARCPTRASTLLNTQEPAENPQDGSLSIRCPEIEASSSTTVSKPSSEPSVTHPADTDLSVTRPFDSSSDNFNKKRSASVISDDPIEQIKTTSSIEGTVEFTVLLAVTSVTQLRNKKPKVMKSASKTVNNAKEPAALKQLLNPVKKFIEESEEFPLDFAQFVNLLSSRDDSTDVMQLVKDHTPSIQGFLNMLKQLYPKLEDRSMKIRFTKLKKKILQFAKYDLLSGWDTSSVETGLTSISPRAILMDIRFTQNGTVPCLTRGARDLFILVPLV